MSVISKNNGEFRCEKCFKEPDYIIKVKIDSRLYTWLCPECFCNMFRCPIYLNILRVDYFVDYNKKGKR